MQRGSTEYVILATRIPWKRFVQNMQILAELHEVLYAREKDSKIVPMQVPRRAIADLQRPRPPYICATNKGVTLGL